MRKVAIITGTRAEYGLLYWIIKGIHDDPELELQLIVTGTHLSPEFGLTVREIEHDAFPISERVEMLLSSDTETAISTSMGIGMIGFSMAYERLNPDILVVLGDRFEILSAVAAAVPFRLPVAHIHGGESTEGAIDELFRHAITKMSHIHFATTRLYASRIIQMGESPENVFCFGAPGLDNIFKLPLINREDLSELLGLPMNKKLGIVTYHPETLEKDTEGYQITEVLQALKTFPDLYWVISLPNADTGGRVIGAKLKDFLKKNPDMGNAFTSIGQLNYTSLLKHAEVMVGNSSSGIIEALSFFLPVVNIGFRQKGRIREKNVIDVIAPNTDDIIAAINKALSDGFRTSLHGIRNPYGDGTASTRIVNTIKTISLSDLRKKRFYDLPTAGL
jgi:UDP-hydrolysing UDP-N-acetyl-D-glucosamine 2-epimerase